MAVVLHRHVLPVSGAQAQVRQAVEDVLKKVFREQEEVPVVATYWKDMCMDLLAIR